jgi:hypothetical protein
MKYFLAIPFISVALMLSTSPCRAQAWRQIVPLKSTRSDVERILGPSNGAYGVTYQLEEGNLFIEYSSGPCRPERKGGWNVPENIVVLVSFTPKVKKRIGVLKLDPKKFRKVVDDHVIGVVYYINDEDGITYSVQAGKVDYVEYGPAKRDDHLYCGDPNLSFTTTANAFNP